MLKKCIKFSFFVAIITCSRLSDGYASEINYDHSNTLPRNSISLSGSDERSVSEDLPLPQTNRPKRAHDQIQGATTIYIPTPKRPKLSRQTVTGSPIITVFMGFETKTPTNWFEDLSAAQTAQLTGKTHEALNLYKKAISKNSYFAPLDVYVAAGHLASRLGKFSDSLTYYDTAIKKNANETLDALKKLINNAEENSYPPLSWVEYFVTAYTSMQQSQFDNVVRYCTEALSRLKELIHNPLNRPHPVLSWKEYFSAAYISSLFHNSDDAIKYYKEALRKNVRSASKCIEETINSHHVPVSWIESYMAGYGASRLGEHVVAVEHYKAAIDTTPERTLSDLEKRINSRYVVTSWVEDYAAGYASSRLNHFDPALDYYKKALMKSPTLVLSTFKELTDNPHNKPYLPLSWMEYCIAGYAASQFSKFDDAVKCYQAATRLSQRNTLCFIENIMHAPPVSVSHIEYYVAGCITSQLNYFGPALSYYERAIRMNRNMPWYVHIEAARLASQLNKPNNAINHYKTGIKKNVGESLSALERFINNRYVPVSWVESYAAGYAAFGMNQYGRALGHYAMALSKNHDAPWFVHTDAAYLASQLGKYRYALSNYDIAIRKNPDVPWHIHTNAGLVGIEMGEFSYAFSHYEEAIRKNPNALWSVYADTGRLASRLGKFDKSINYYEAALEKNPTGVLNALERFINDSSVDWPATWVEYYSASQAFSFFGKEQLAKEYLQKAKEKKIEVEAIAGLISLSDEATISEDLLPRALTF